MSARISSLPVVVSANIADTDILPIVVGIASNTGVTKRVSVSELRLKLGTTAPAAGRTVTSAAQYLLNNAVFNVKDFGAFGDGVTDDTIAIQLAATTVPIGGGILFFPVGTYKITSKITIRGSTVVRGSGKDASIVKQYSNVSGFYASVTLGCRNLRFEDLSILDGFGSGRSAGYGLDLDGTSDIVTGHFEHLVISGFQDDLHINRMQVSTISNVLCTNAKRDGFVLDGICTSTTISDTYSNGNTRYGYNVTGGSGYITLEATAADANGDDAYHFGNNLSGCANITLVNPGCETNAGHGFYFKDAARVVLIAPVVSHLTGVTKDGIRFEGCVRCSVISGLFWDTTGYGINILASSTPITSAKIVLHEMEFQTNALGTINDPNSAVTRWDGKAFTVGTPAGSETTATLVGRFDSNLGVGANVGAGQTDLLSTTIPANTLTTNGQAIRIHAAGYTAANANAKRIRLWLGTEVLLDPGSLALNNVFWVYDITITRNGSAGALVTGFYGSSDGTVLPIKAYYGGATRDWTTALVLKLTGTATADNDIVQREHLVEILT